MRLSVHPCIKGKLPRDTNINMGFGWENIDVSWRDAFELITVDGYASSAELASDHRTSSNFVSRQLWMIDIDEGMSIFDLLENEFYNEYSAGFYATPSFTHEHHKFRILFVLESPIYKADELRKLNRALFQVFTNADVACKDAARLFYGTPDCEVKEFRDAILPNDVIKLLIDMVNKQDEESMRNYVPVEHEELTDEKKQLILDLLKGMYVGNYPVWRNIGWGLKSGGFELKDFQYVTQGLMAKKTPSDAKQVWTSGGTSEGGVTMGSVIYLIKQHYGPDVFREQYHKSQLDKLYDEFNKKSSQLTKEIDKWHRQ